MSTERIFIILGISCLFILAFTALLGGIVQTDCTKCCAKVILDYKEKGILK